MPFGSFNLPPTTGGAITAAGIDALLALARLSGSDGDTYQDTNTGARFIYDDSGSGILIPAAWSGNTLTLLSNAHGSAYITLADTEGDFGDDDTDQDLDPADIIAGRGWMIYEAGAGTVVKTADNPLVLDAGGIGGVALVQFNPTSAISNTRNYLGIVKIAVAVAETQRSGFRLTDPTKHRELSAGDVDGAGTTAGNYACNNAGTVKGGASMSLGTGARWISIYFGSTGEAVIAAPMDDTTKGCLAQYSDMASGATPGYFRIHCQRNIASNELSIYECFVFEVT